ncbi:MAG: hypothetical protein ACR2K1_12755 [Saprospiraceae bacterium]
MKLPRCNSSRQNGWIKKCNWLAGLLYGLKSPVSRHTSQFFLIIALLWPAKNRFLWRKTNPFWAQTRPANPLQKNANAQKAHWHLIYRTREAEIND